jgi:outer membrane receptor protein involved in Fe transport
LNSQTDTAVSPRSVIVIRTIPDHAFRIGYGLAFRKPSIAESRLHYKMEDFNPAMPEVVDLVASQFGNENLRNEKVYSFEVGWRARFLDEELQVGADLFYDSYIDPIVFNTDLAINNFGAPDIPNSNIQFINEDAEYTAVGGEAEIAWSLPDWTLWANFTLRRVANSETGEARENEPNFRLNLGARYFPPNGFFSDVALHFVSRYRPLLLNPESPLDEFVSMDLGNSFLLIARLGYRKSFTDSALKIETGLAIRTPLGASFREYAGVPYTPALTSFSTTDFGGEVLIRRLSLYIRGSI